MTASNVDPRLADLAADAARVRVLLGDERLLEALSVVDRVVAGAVGLARERGVPEAAVTLRQVGLEAGVVRKVDAAQGRDAALDLAGPLPDVLARALDGFGARVALEA